MSDTERRKVRSRELVAERIAMLPQVIAEALRSAASLQTPMLARARGTWVITGVGASCGPARALATLLRSELGLASEYVPLSAFVHGAEPPVSADVLVVFSQRLSPNALLPLASARFAERWVFTTLDPQQDTRAAELASQGIRFVVHPPTEESDLFLRLLGPAAATACALFWVGALARAMSLPPPAWSPGLDAVPAAVREASVRAMPAPRGAGLDSTHRIAFVAAGRSLALSAALPLKWIEGVGGVEPPLWDALGFVHGPMQALYEGSLTLVGLEAPGQRDLFDRLERVLDPARHSLARLEAKLPAPLSLFEHDVLVSRLVLGVLQLTPRDLLEWPGKGADAPLYELGERRVGRA